ncbi:hypothetical protein BLOT_013379 [Blomia tropicalis]|nr:hypothetical protein BLOT_013379 [Blomia tropicalis]
MATKEEKRKTKIDLVTREKIQNEELYESFLVGRQTCVLFPLYLCGSSFVLSKAFYIFIFWKFNLSE